MVRYTLTIKNAVSTFKHLIFILSLYYLIFILSYLILSYLYIILSYLILSCDYFVNVILKLIKVSKNYLT